MPGSKKTGHIPQDKTASGLGSTRYFRVIDAMETKFSREHNETYETFQLLARKQHIGDSLEQFHSVLSGLAAR